MIYLDASALVKLLVEERETAALQGWVAGRPDRISSIVVAAELRRAARRALAAGDLQRETEVVLNCLQLLNLDEHVVQGAARLDPPALRSLDAIHVATALSVEDVEYFVSYDARLSGAARAAGLAVATPGA